MEMSLDYMRKTAEHLRALGYAIEENSDTQEGVFTRTSVRFRKSPAVDFEMEHIQYVAGKVKYYLELHGIGPLRCYSFELDSWKYHKDRIELKFAPHPDTGMGLAFEIAL